MRLRYINLIIVFSILISFDTVRASESNPHADLPCIKCHKKSAESGYSGLKKAACLQCHQRHDAKVIHDPHIDVPCEACHLKDIRPIRKKGGGITWEKRPDENGVYNPHKMIVSEDKICSRCHYKNNDLGVSQYVLPAKSIICMPCHSGTFSASDPITIIALIVFFIGTFSVLLAWARAGKRKRNKNRRSPANLIDIIKALILDGFLQRGLLKVSVWRWIIHSMIFFPIIIRFLWGLTALISSTYFPEWGGAWVMLDKNNPVTALLFDITGIIILFGGCCMILQKRAAKRRNGIRNLPETNSLIHILLGGIIITGFFLEGARISMTGSPAGSEYAFIGYAIGGLLHNFNLTGVYSYVYYFHAAVTGLFVACIPFSRMFHIIIAPLSAAIKAASKE